MLKYELLKNTFRKNKVLFKNFSALSLLQLSQYIFPLITFPYLVRVLGPDGYGLVAFATAFTGYFIVITDYGFNLSATREISVNRNDNTKLSQIFSSVIIVKIFLFFASSIVFIVIVNLFSKFNQNLDIYLLSYISVLGTTLFPVWFFQGVERMGFITVINLIVKGLWVISVFIFIHSIDDLQLLIFMTSISSVLVGLIGIIAVKIYFPLIFHFPKLDDIIYQLKDSWHYFVSTVSISIYTTSSIFLLGLFTNNLIVGFYAAGEKIVRAIQSLFEPLFKVLFPNIAHIHSKNRKDAYIKISKTIKLIIIPSTIVSISIFIFAEEIVNTILGNEYKSTIVVLIILSFLPFILSLAKSFANLFMLNFGLVIEWRNLIILASIFSVFAILIFVYLLQLEHIGMAISILLTELVVLISSLYYFYSFKQIIKL